jgi:arylsulfatase A-like enzyme
MWLARARSGVPRPRRAGARPGLALALLVLAGGCARSRERVAPQPPVRPPVEDVIDLLSLLPTAEFDARPGGLRLLTTVVRDEIRESVIVRPPFAIRFPAVPLHAGARLAAGCGAARPAGGTAPDVTCVVRVELGDRVEEVWRKVLPVRSPATDGWSDFEVPLPRGEGPGETAALVLEVSGGDAAVVAGWSLPLIFSDGVPGPAADRVAIREDDVADLVAAFPVAQLEAGPHGAPRRLTAPPVGSGSPSVRSALVVPAGAAVRWTLALAPADELRFRYHLVRDSAAAAAAGEEGFSLRWRRREAGAPPGPWLGDLRRSVSLGAVRPGLLRARTLQGTLPLEVPEAGRWELELRGEGPAERTGVWSAFAVLRQVRRSEVPRRRPADGGRNVVLVVADTLRADRLGLYGYPRPTSPVLDAEAVQGVVFEDCVPPAPHTLPSTATILTGVLPRRHGVFPFPAGDQRLGPDLTTIAEAAQQAGYSTAALVANCILPAGSGFDQGFEQYRAACGLRGDRLTRLARRWLEQHRDERFLLYLHYMDPHSPYAAPEPYHGMFDPEYAGAVDRDTWDGRFWRSRVLVRAVNEGFPVTLRPELGEEARFEVGPQVGVGTALMRRLSELYDGEVRYWDAQLGPVLAALRELGLWDETVVAVVGDHGEEFGEEGHLAHGNDFAAAVMHVPFVLLGAGVGAPRRVPNLVTLADVTPTLLDLAGLPAPADLDGRALLAAGPAPAAAPALAWTRAYWVSRSSGVRHQTAVLARTADLDVVHLPADDRWLTRARAAGGPPAPVPADAVPAELRRELLERGPILPTRGASQVGPAAPMTDRELEVLRALGYLR